MIEIHSEDLEKTAQESYRVLKPGGWCVHADRIFGSTHKRSLNKSALKKPLTSEKIFFRYGEEYSDKIITSEMLSTHWRPNCEIEYPFIKANFTIRSITMIKIPIIKFLLYLIYKLIGNFLLQHSHRYFIGSIPIYPWYTHVGDIKILTYKNLLFLCQKPSVLANENNAVLKKQHWLRRVLRYFFVTNRQMERKYKNDLKNILSL